MFYSCKGNPLENKTMDQRFLSEETTPLLGSHLCMFSLLKRVTLSANHVHLPKKKFFSCLPLTQTLPSFSSSVIHIKLTVQSLAS